MEQNEFLRKLYLDRRRKNGLYSLRAFANAIDVRSGRLSEYLQGKRKITPAMAERIADALALTLKERRMFVVTQKKGGGTSPSFTPLREDEFAVIADPLHFHLLSLLETKDGNSTAAISAARLGRTVIEARDALDRLVRLGLLAKDGDVYTVINSEVTTSHDVPSAALKASHKASLAAAVKAIDRIPVELRDVSGITMAVDVSKLPEAKKLIRRFRREMAALLESGTKSEVFDLNIQLIPVTNMKKVL